VIIAISAQESTKQTGQYQQKDTAALSQLCEQSLTSATCRGHLVSLSSALELMSFSADVGWSSTLIHIVAGRI
jgi:hypothetical protein